jgi:hypothetical protein
MRSPKILVPALAAVAVVAAFYFLALAPKREEATKLDGSIATKQQEVDQSKALLASYQDAKSRYKANYATIARLGKAVPADDDIRSLLVQISDAADKSDVTFHALTVGGSGGAEPQAAAPGQLAPPPGTVAVGSAGFKAMPFSFGFEGSYFRLSSFFNRLEDFVTVENKNLDVTGRLLLIGSINVLPEQDSKQLTATIGAASYLVPPATDVTGAPASGAAASGTAGATTPTTPATGTTPTTPTTPTATITGVR